MTVKSNKAKWRNARIGRITFDTILADEELRCRVADLQGWSRSEQEVRSDIYEALSLLEDEGLVQNIKVWED